MCISIGEGYGGEGVAGGSLFDIADQYVSCDTSQLGSSREGCGPGAGTSQHSTVRVYDFARLWAHGSWFVARAEAGGWRLLSPIYKYIVLQFYNSAILQFYNSTILQFYVNNAIIAW